MSRQVLPLIVPALLLLTGPALAQKGTTSATGTAAPAAAETLTPDQARRALETLQDDARRAQMIETLRAIAKAAPGAAPNGTTPNGTAASGASETPAAKPETKPETKPDAAEKPALPTLDADSLGAQLLLSFSNWVANISREVTWAARSTTHFPTLWNWLVTATTDPFYYHLLLDIAWKFALVFGCAFVVERLVRWA
ncbi:MAG: hypothetical protein WBA29_16360, partial [Xanthobacteraceae bacterium]